MTTINKEEMYLTTFDNPFDPFTQFDEWNNFDCQKGYNTCGYVDRIVNSRNDKKLSTRATDEEVDEAIKEIVAMNPTIYKLVYGTIEVSTIDMIE